MYLIIVYDTEQANCVKLHKLLKQYLHWNQRSVFEGQVTKGQFAEIKAKVESVRAKKSHVVFYQIDDPKWLQKEELGDGEGNTSNVL